MSVCVCVSVTLPLSVYFRSTAGSHTTSTSNNHVADTTPVRPPRKHKTADSKTGQSAPVPELSAADSLAQALGFAPIPPLAAPAASNESTDKEQISSTTARAGETTAEKTKEQWSSGDKTKPKGTAGDRSNGRGTTAVVKSGGADPLAEAFGFDTTPEDIEDILELMGPDSDATSFGRGMDSGYMTSNPMQTKTDDYAKWTNFDNTS